MFMQKNISSFFWLSIGYMYLEHLFGSNFCLFPEPKMVISRLSSSTYDSASWHELQETSSVKLLIQDFRNEPKLELNEHINVVKVALSIEQSRLYYQYPLCENEQNEVTRGVVINPQVCLACLKPMQWKLFQCKELSMYMKCYVPIQLVLKMMKINCTTFWCAADLYQNV